MTANNAPHTALGFVIRELRGAAYSGAIEGAMAFEANSPARRAAVERAKQAFQMDVEDEARELLTYLVAHFGSTVTPATVRVNDDRYEARLDEADARRRDEALGLR